MIWLYPAKASMSDISLFPEVDSTRRSICGNGKLSFGQALFSSVKSTQTLHLPFFFLSTTGFASQLGYFASVMEPILNSFSTSAFTASACSRPNVLLFCLTCLNIGSTLSSCTTIWTLTPGMSFGDQAKVLTLSLRKQISSAANFYALLGVFVVETNGDYGVENRLCWLPSLLDL